jgi:hypothetical protein
MMSFREANETAICQKAQIGVVVGQMRKGVESDAVQRYKSRGGEQRLFEERDPINAMVIGHGLLNYSTPL